MLALRTISTFAAKMPSLYCGRIADLCRFLQRSPCLLVTLHILDSMPGQVSGGTYRIQKIRLEDATADVQMDRQVGNLALESRLPGECEGSCQASAIQKLWPSSW